MRDTYLNGEARTPEMSGPSANLACMSAETTTPRGEAQGARVAYRTDLGFMVHGRVEDALDGSLIEHKGRVQLIFTSPPFPLNRKKAYGNRVGDEYVDWLSDLTPRLVEMLAPDGSLVVEIGNAWESGSPVMSVLPLRALMAILETGDLHLSQQFIVHNPARLPSPAQWVNIERCRVKDSYTNVWWMAPSERPKADNRRVLVEYSDSMKKLLKRKSYNSGKRPSGHDIGEESFLSDNGGAIPPNVLVAANTRSKADAYREHCLFNDLPVHPARMAPDIVEFFIRFLTDEGDVVLDPFAGSNTTGSVAEDLNRRWIGVEADGQYVAGSVGRFSDPVEAVPLRALT